MMYHWRGIALGMGARCGLLGVLVPLCVLLVAIAPAWLWDRRERRRFAALHAMLEAKRRAMGLP